MKNFFDTLPKKDKPKIYVYDNEESILESHLVTVFTHLFDHIMDPSVYADIQEICNDIDWDFLVKCVADFGKPKSKGKKKQSQASTNQENLVDLSQESLRQPATSDTIAKKYDSNRKTYYLEKGLTSNQCVNTSKEYHGVPGPQKKVYPIKDQAICAKLDKEMEKVFRLMNLVMKVTTDPELMKKVFQPPEGRQARFAGTIFESYPENLINFLRAAISGAGVMVGDHSDIL